METKNTSEPVTRAVIKTGKDLSQKELEAINHHRQSVFGTNDPYVPMPDNKDWSNRFILIKNCSDELLSFGRIHPIKLSHVDGTYTVNCFTGVVSTRPGQGYGKLVIDEMKKIADASGKTVIGFCETDLLPFYRKCGYEVLSPEDNQFVYVDERGVIIPKIVPGEVIYYPGKDGIIEKILNSSDKTVRVRKNDF